MSETPTTTDLALTDLVQAGPFTARMSNEDGSDFVDGMVTVTLTSGDGEASRRVAQSEASEASVLTAILGELAAEIRAINDLVPRCGDCGRQRTLTDVNDYNPLQAIMGAPFGWYSGDDGEMCPECFTKLMRGGR